MHISESTMNNPRPYSPSLSLSLLSNLPFEGQSSAPTIAKAGIEQLMMQQVML